MKKLTLSIIILVAGILISLNLKSQNGSLANIDQFIIDYMQTNHKPGLAACIIKGDTVFWRGNFGYAILEDSLPVSDTTLFNAFSIGKTITAVSVMQLWEDGLIELDDNVNNILPFQVDNPNFEPDSITPRFLMTHSSGIIDYNWLSYVTVGDPTMYLGDFLENYLSSGGSYYSANNFSNITPGTFNSYSYSNIGSGLNGFLVEVLTPLSFKDYADEYLLTPLGMNRSAWFLAELNVDNLAVGYDYTSGQYVPWAHYGIPFYPGMSLRSNAMELAQFVIMMLNGGQYNNSIILESSTVDSMCTLQLDFLYTGLGLRRETINCITGGKVIWGHKGGGDFGYTSEIQFCRSENIGIVYMSNTSVYAPPVTQRLLEYAAMIVISEPATQVSDSSFYANWQMAPDANGYFLDVALDENYTSFVPGYENMLVGSEPQYCVTGLNSNTEYFYRIRAVNDYDTGAYSNTINLTTLLGTGITNHNRENIRIWSTGKTIYIDVADGYGTKARCWVYSLSGQCLGSFKLIDGLNSIPLNVKRQPLCVKVSCRNKNFYKKVMVW